MSPLYNYSTPSQPTIPPVQEIAPLGRPTPTTKQFDIGTEQKRRTKKRELIFTFRKRDTPITATTTASTHENTQTKLNRLVDRPHARKTHTQTSFVVGSRRSLSTVIATSHSILNCVILRLCNYCSLLNFRPSISSSSRRRQPRTIVHSLQLSPQETHVHDTSFTAAQRQRLESGRANLIQHRQHQVARFRLVVVCSCRTRNKESSVIQHCSLLVWLYSVSVPSALSTPVVPSIHCTSSGPPCSGSPPLFPPILVSRTHRTRTDSTERPRPLKP